MHIFFERYPINVEVDYREVSICLAPRQEFLPFTVPLYHFTLHYTPRRPTTILSRTSSQPYAQPPPLSGHTCSLLTYSARDQTWPGNIFLDLAINISNPQYPIAFAPQSCQNRISKILPACRRYTNQNRALICHWKQTLFLFLSTLLSRR